MKTSDYIAALKPLTKTGSLYAVAQLLDVSENAVHHYAKGRRHFDAYAAFRVAELLDLPPAQVIADVEAERETDEKRRDYWRELARKSLGSTVAVALAIGAVWTDSEASFLQKPSSESRGFDKTKIIALRNINYTAFAGMKKGSV